MAFVIKGTCSCLQAITGNQREKSNLYFVRLLLRMVKYNCRAREEGAFPHTPVIKGTSNFNCLAKNEKRKKKKNSWACTDWIEALALAPRILWVNPVWTVRWGCQTVETSQGKGILSNKPNWDYLTCWQMERNKCVHMKVVGVVNADFISDAILM